MPNAYISGTGYFVPDDVVTNDELAKRFNIDTNDEWIRKRTGIEERRFAPDGMGTAFMGARAAEQAIEAAGLTTKDIDMIVLGTLSPECTFPGTGVFVQRELGFADVNNFVPCLDIRNQCSGFLYGLGTAASMVRGGGYKNVLLIGAECHSHALDLSTRGRTVASLFGDGAGAVIVSATDEDRGVRRWTLGADGRFAETLWQRVWDIQRFPFIPQNEEGQGLVEPELMWAQMDGRQVFRHAVEKMITSLMTVCWQEKIEIKDVDLFLFHQANLRINEYIQKQLNIPDDKVFNNIMRYGNTTAGTIPILMAEAEREGILKPGMKVGMAAFGSGFTWGAALMDW
ncbi:MAG: ketoacyl-ACP synthase III [Deltaproteobacteria bacterium]|nr:MAG: ketoacyl-ACP synthase III [Deltaproteobacteria bacterium]